MDTICILNDKYITVDAAGSDHGRNEQSVVLIETAWNGFPVSKHIETPPVPTINNSLLVICSLDVISSKPEDDDEEESEEKPPLIGFDEMTSREHEDDDEEGSEEKSPLIGFDEMTSREHEDEDDDEEGSEEKPPLIGFDEMTSREHEDDDEEGSEEKSPLIGFDEMTSREHEDEDDDEEGLEEKSPWAVESLHAFRTLRSMSPIGQRIYERFMSIIPMNSLFNECLSTQKNVTLDNFLTRWPDGKVSNSGPESSRFETRFHRSNSV
ncbi:hypothetical protein AVEN_189719-1 [Araneus ventricosus]|uniref:Uncharacterized protein n=1 Tax=Araneus ventricosus TaxID=182803 RepID=A0A4Y2J2G8_ARAVE|nr:hypothetical protein AVEN_189719-1 [Araneus ventricosus]